MSPGLKAMAKCHMPMTPWVSPVGFNLFILVCDLSYRL